MFFISVTPVKCLHNCMCHYDQENHLNVYHCNGFSINNFPRTIPNLTDWIVMTNINVSALCGKYQYLDQVSSNVSRLSITSTNLSVICDETLGQILNNQNIKSFNLANNNLMSVSPEWQKEAIHMEQLWLGGNPILCGCDMFWMVDWLRNSTNSSGQRLVQDYKDVVCTYGQEMGKPVHEIDRVSMGCYPKDVPKWIIEVATSVSTLILIIVITVLLIHRYRLIIRWLIYKNFDKLIGDPDRLEDVTGIEFDAFLSFR